MMQLKLKQLITLSILLGSKLVYAEDTIQTVKTINFVVTTMEDEECTFPLTPTETLDDLRRGVSLGCGYKFAFEIELLGETIVPFQSSTILGAQAIAENPAISATWKLLSEMWDDTKGFRIPLKVKRVPSEEDIAVY